jgi:purine-binding chemotaxis protein CheW
MPSPASSPTDRYLCVDLQSEQYAVPILCVREIQAYAVPTPLPRMAPHVRGVINLHGEIVPAVDLRRRVGMAEQTYGRLTVTVFVAAGSQVVGLIVDAAWRVIDLERAQIKPPPDVADGVDVSFVAGLARAGDRLVVVLDIGALLRGDPALAASLDATGALAEQRRGP